MNNLQNLTSDQYAAVRVFHDTVCRAALANLADDARSDDAYRLALQAEMDGLRSAREEVADDT